MTYCFVNPPPGEVLDYETLIPWLNEEYPDGWVIVNGRGANPSMCSSMLGLGAGDVLVSLYGGEETTGDGDDRCKYCRHKRADHTMPVRIGCNHGLCACFHFEEPENQISFS